MHLKPRNQTHINSQAFHHLGIQQTPHYVIRYKLRNIIAASDRLQCYSSMNFSYMASDLDSFFMVSNDAELLIKSRSTIQHICSGTGVPSCPSRSAMRTVINPLHQLALLEHDHHGTCP